MARYHINAKGEVKPCSAAVGKCRFGGASGKEGHFTSKVAADEAATKLLQASFPALSSSVRAVTGERFEAIREGVSKALVTYGGVASVADLPAVRSVDEIITRWFEGDGARYRSFRRLITDDSMTDASKKSVGGLIRKGVSVDTSKTLEALSKPPRHRGDESHIDLLDEEVTGLKLASLKQEPRRAF